jgi:uncharacterized protein (TIGR02646 family)
MIRIARTRVKEPASLRSPRTRAAMKRLETFFDEDPKKRAQREAPFDVSIYKDREVREALLELFHSKCAYCETPLPGVSLIEIDQFRPKARAVDLDGRIAHDGYWWLAYDWSNLYAACRNCNRLKGSRFPLEPNTQRAMFETRTAVAAERRLLLDPCEDDPQEHLVFLDDGRVASSTDRGRTTIDMFGLNRESLVRDRLATVERFVIELTLALAQTKRDPQLIERLAGDSQPYAAARRQVLAARLRDLKQTMAVPPAPAGSSAVRLPDITPEKRQETSDSFRAAQQEQESYSIDDEGSKAKYFARTRLIDRIEISNFRPIESLALEFPVPASGADPDPARQSAGQPSWATSWLMLLGENGSGKSSVLQAVALTLIGEEWRNRLPLGDASRFVRRGADEGYVRITLTGVEKPIELRFSKSSSTFTSEPKEPKMLLLGYGSTRLLPRAGLQSQTKRNFDFARIDNLFDPFEPLNDAAAWLVTLPPERFDSVARALKAVLQLGPDDRLICEGGKIEAEIFGSRVTLDELSDGYQSVVALATDIMRVMLNRWDAMEVAEGIVLLDEIGSHLHPRWRMRIVDALRQCFPRIQFLVSTHDPLCLRGLAAGEVAVVSRDAKKRVVANTDLPPIGGLRVDQLLTSEYFGLNSTIDPAVEDLFTEYYTLLALRKPTRAQKDRLAVLKAQLEQFRMLGANQRERLMLEAIDQFLADEKASPSGNRVALKAATRNRLAEIWANTPAAPPTRRGGTTA